MNSHLSSEQLDGVLNGGASQDASQHLGGCVQCAGELAALRAAFGDLRDVTTAVAEHHRRLAVATPVRRIPRMVWGLAAAALFVGIATPVAVHRRTTSVVGEKVPQVVATMSDEALLNSVQNDLSASVPESLLPLASASTNAADSVDTLSTDTQRKNQ
jgi:hypothetical protein